jgi:crossover junction endodeoxyribonuclease RuvC
MGYSVIEVKGQCLAVKEMDVLKLSASLDHYERLQRIHQRITELVDQFSPTAFAIEAPFFGKNVQSMLKLGRAQGVAIAAAMQRAIPVTEYSPKKVKQSITGNGNADKEQVFKMLQQLAPLPDRPKYFDATDALAVAICHHFGSRLPLPRSTHKQKKTVSQSWESFARNNPGRLA